MTKASLRRIVLTGAAVFLLAAAAAHPAQAQDSNAPTALDRQLAKVELAVTAAGEFTSTTSGNTIGTSTTTGTNTPVSDSPSKTVGVLATLSYTHSPFVGFEINYNQTRLTQNYIYTNVTLGATAGSTISTPTPLGVQNSAVEFTFGYLVHTPKTYYGVQPFASVGAGTIDFRPTTNGGLGTTSQARAAYYYNLGAQLPLYGEHFGARVAFRQLFFLAPDFQETYLRDHQHAVETQPTIGFYLKF